MWVLCMCTDLPLGIGRAFDRGKKRWIEDGCLNAYVNNSHVQGRQHKSRQGYMCCWDAEPFDARRGKKEEK